MIILPNSIQPLVSILICVSSGIDLLIECLTSIVDHAPVNLHFETIIVLNEPYNEDEERLRLIVSGAQIIASPVNLGLAGAANRGRAAARGEFILLLHDDTVVRAGWMENLVRAGREHPEAGAIGSRILNMDGSFQSAGSILWSNGSTTSCNEILHYDHEIHDKIQYVDHCGTSSILIRSRILDLSGGFDENLFPAYYIDVDICMTIRSLGHAIICDPSSEVLHHRSASSNIGMRSFAFNRNKNYFIKKWSSLLTEQPLFDFTNPVAAISQAQYDIANRTYLDATNIVSSFSVSTFNIDQHQRHHSDLSRRFRESFQLYLSVRSERGATSEKRLTPYELGAKLKFGFDGSGHNYLVDDHWHQTEEWGLWSKEKKLTILIPLADRHTADLQSANKIKLMLTAIHHLGPKRPLCVISVNVNNSYTVQIHEMRSSFINYEISMPVKKIGRNPWIVIEIETEDPISPEEMSGFPDDRKMAFGLQNLEIEVDEDV